MWSIPVQRHSMMNSERVFVGGIAILSVVLVSIYQSKLATMFTTPHFHKDINSLEELDQSGLKIVTEFGEFKVDVFASEASETFKKLSEKIVLFENLSIIDQMVGNGEAATLKRKRNFRLTHVGQSTFHMIEECPKKYNLGFVLPKNSQFLETFNIVQLKIMDAGLIEKFISDMEFNETFEYHYHNAGIDFVPKVKVFNLYDLMLAFTILGIGNLIGLISFSAEILCKKFKVFSKEISKSKCLKKSR
jgi:hypothetical protein